MGLFDRYRGWLGRRKEKKDNKRLDRLEADLNMLSARGIKYNPKYYRPVETISPEQEFSLSVIENLVWFTGKPRLIRQFYALNAPFLVSDLNFFWVSSPAEYRKVHAGLPGLISTKMATILLGGGIIIEVEIYKLNDKGEPTENIDEAKSKVAKSNVETLKDKTLFLTRVSEAVVTESWSGHVFIKYGYDLDASAYPIIEIADVRNAEVIKIRGITTAIVFKNYYTVGPNQYVHKETYTTDENDDAMIINELFKISPSGDEKPVPLSTLPETEELKEVFVFKGLKGMIAFEKPNKLPNNEFPDSSYGASDYAGAHSSYDALDEVLSEMYSEVRNNKSMRYIPDTMLKYIDGDIARLDPFVRNYVKITGDPDQNAKNEIFVTAINDKQASLHAKWQVAITTALNIAGLSPYSIGITGLESVNQSAESQQERNKATLETRSAKLKAWGPFLENMFMQLLSFNSWMQKNLKIAQEDMDELDIDFANCNVVVKFGDYIIEKQDDKINTWGAAKQFRVASTLECVKNIHPDWSERRIDEEVNLIRFEEGMALDNPDNLPKLTGFSYEDEDDDDDDEQETQEEQKTKEKDMTKVIESQEEQET